MLTINDTAPDFSAETVDGEIITLSEFKNKKNVILFFYSKAFSLVCSNQVCRFRDAYEELIGYSCEIIGVSFDSIDTQSEFKTTLRLPFHIISDSDKKIAGAYEVMRFGGYLPFVKRVTFVIDKDGIIRNIIHHEFNISRHTIEAKKTLLAIMESGT
jgi:thioredoxin-dependent peroxiredoxin